MSNNKFQTGTGCYICGNCGKKTRETGSGESDCGLCLNCFELSGLENQHSDEGHSGNFKVCSVCLGLMSLNNKNHLNIYGD